MRKPPARRRAVSLALEVLELRLPLAGDVTASLSAAGDLKISGDDAENAVLVFIRPGLDGAPDQLVVQGDTFTDEDSTTTVEGAQEKAFNVPAAGLRKVTIDLGKALTPAGDARGPLGADGMFLTGLVIAGDLTIKGKNAGAALLEEVSVRGKTTLDFDTGEGVLFDDPESDFAASSALVLINCRLGIGPVENPNLTPRKDVLVNTKSGRDFLLVGGTEIGRHLSASLKAGGDFAICMPSDEDQEPIEVPGFPFLIESLDSETIVGGNLKLDTGVDDDEVKLLNFAARGTTMIKTGAGNDEVFLGDDFDPNVTTNFDGNVSVDTGAGNDLVVMVNLEAGGTATIKAGAGNDDVELGDRFLAGATTTFRGKTIIDLGEGVAAVFPHGDAAALMGVLASDETADSSTVFEQDVTIKSKSGDDCIGLFGVGLEKSLSVDSGKGHDLFAAANFGVLGKATIKTGDGDDTVYVDALQNPGVNFIGESVTIDTGKGIDFIAADAVRIGGKVSLKAGADRDIVVFELVEISLNERHLVDGGAADNDELSTPTFIEQVFTNFEDFDVDEAAFFADVLGVVDDCFSDILEDLGLELPTP